MSCRLLKREGIRTALVPDLAAVPRYNSCQAVQRGLRQSTNEILMVAPTAFGFNSEAAEDNYFMNDTLKGGKGTAPGTEVTNRVLQEFSGLYRELTEVRLAGWGEWGQGGLFGYLARGKARQAAPQTGPCQLCRVFTCSLHNDAF